MEFVDQIIHAKYIITCEDENTIFENHSLVIKDGKIKDIVVTDKINESYKTNITHHCTSHALIPGFVNSHTHLGMTYLRGIADDLPLYTWLTQHIWPTEKKFMNHEFVFDGTQFAIAELIRSGTTCFNEMYFFMDDTIKAMHEAKIRGHVGLHFINTETAWAKNFEDEYEKALSTYNNFKNVSPLIGFTITPHSIYMVPEEYLIKVKELAEKYDLKINIHLVETLKELNDSLNSTKQTPIARLAQIGLLTPRLIAIHMVHFEEGDFALLKKGQPNIVHCPASNMKLSSGTCPVTKLQSLGLNVALGTDGSASNNDLNMISEMRLASFLAKHETEDPTSLSAENVLRMATLNGAKALGIDHITGSITRGKSADITAINLEQLETLPLYHPISGIVYAASRQRVDHVWVEGRQLMKDRKLLTINEEDIIAKAKRWGEIIIAK